MCDALLARPALLQAKLAGAVAVAADGVATAEHYEQQATAFLATVSSPTAAPSDAAGNTTINVDEQLAAMFAAFELAAHYQQAAASGRLSVKVRKDCLALQQHESMGRRSVWAAERFELEAISNFHNRLVADAGLSRTQSEEMQGRKAIVLDFVNFFQYCEQNEPLWRLAALHESERQKLIVQAERAIRREAEDELGLIAAKFLEFTDEAERIAVMYPNRPTFVGAPSGATPLFEAGVVAGGGVSVAGAVGKSGSPAPPSGVSSSITAKGASAAHYDPTMPVAHSSMISNSVAGPSAAAAAGLRSTPPSSPEPEAANPYAPKGPNPYAPTSNPYAPQQQQGGSRSPPQEETLLHADLTNKNLKDNDLTRLNSRPYDAATLRSANLTHNNLRSLEALPVLPKLDTLGLAYNGLADSGAVVQVLKQRCPRLVELTLSPNPCAPANLAPQMHANYRAYVVANMPRLAALDGVQVSQAERSRASQLFPNGRPAGSQEQQPQQQQPKPQQQQQQPPQQGGGYPAPPQFGSYAGQHAAAPTGSHYFGNTVQATTARGGHATHSYSGAYMSAGRGRGTGVPGGQPPPPPGNYPPAQQQPGQQGGAYGYPPGNSAPPGGPYGGGAYGGGSGYGAGAGGYYA